MLKIVHIMIQLFEDKMCYSKFNELSREQNMEMHGLIGGFRWKQAVAAYQN